jgi:hypothetical protein
VTLTQATVWAGRAKDQAYRDPGLRITRVALNQIRLEVERPARGVVLAAPDGSCWRDNMFDLLPGVPQIVEATGDLGALKTLRVSCLAFVDREIAVTG